MHDVTAYSNPDAHAVLTSRDVRIAPTGNTRSDSRWRVLESAVRERARISRPNDTSGYDTAAPDRHVDRVAVCQVRRIHPT
jgi:hypothetical protein